MADVVHAPDHHSTFALLDQRDRGVLNLEWKDSLRRLADDPVQRDLDHSAMRDDQHIAVRMPSHDRLDRGADSRIEDRSAFTTRHYVPVRLFDPARPRFGKSFGHLLGMQPLPLTQVDLAQRLCRLRWHADRLADHLGGLQSALQVARVQAAELATGESRPDEGGLPAPFAGKWGVELPLNPMVAVPGRLPVADEQEARGRWPRR